MRSSFERWCAGALATLGQRVRPFMPLTAISMQEKAVQISPFLVIGQALPNANLITRGAPGVGGNLGGAIEVVTDFYGVTLSAFTMP
jgi:hypothetical protein